MVSEDKQQLKMSISHGQVLPTFLATQTLVGMLERAAQSINGIVVGEGDRQTDLQSYQDLLTEAASILTGLRQLGLQPQARVILQLQPRCFFASLWACWLGGFVPIPIGVDLGFQEDLVNSKLYQAWEISDRPTIITDIVRKNSHSSLQEVQVEELLNNSPDSNYHHGKLDDLALLLFTSGSTGKPKGVMLSARNLIASVYGMAKVNNLSGQDITLNWMPLEHVASLVMFHLTPLYLGCQQIQVKSELILQNPFQWLNLIDQYRVTATWSPNFAYNLVNEKLGTEGVAKHDWDLSCLRWMGNGAEAVVGNTTRRFLELLTPYGLSPTVVSPGYGMSETTSGIAHSHDFWRNKGGGLVSVGSPIPGVSLRIVNEKNQVVPEGEIGLLQVKGETVTAGYLKQPELNEAMLIQGWFNTGDLGFIEAGKLTITGRQKDVIIINGVNYYNHDLETVVEAIAGVNISFTAACGVQGNNQQEEIAVFFNTDAQQDKLRELINTIRRSVLTQIGVAPTYIVPVTKEMIPKTAIGKIMRSQLSQRFNTGEFNHILAEVGELFNQRDLSPQELPSNAIEQKLVAVWQEVLNIDKVGVKDNFFELGGNSLLLMQVLSKLTPEHHISAVTLFQYPTICALAGYLDHDANPRHSYSKVYHKGIIYPLGQAQENPDLELIAVEQGKRRGELRRQTGNQDVAIIGMSCRFPGANNINQFWDNLCHGVESISFFADAEIINSGVDPELVKHPNYVKASPILDDIESFDADFWGYSPKEAQLLDPQQRLFLECAWECLEDAGYDPFTYQGDISLYGGAATNTYLLNNIYPHRAQIDEQDSLQVINLSSMGGFQVSTANDKDYLTTRTSYKLNLKGSSINVQTACSTSLVTVHLACQSLINSECDMALAGGVSVHSPQKMGYLYQEGMILSADGHCRAFDAEASGTIFGSGAGMVVLKLLDRAIEDGDRIYGIIKGSAVNNDGGTKVGYFAPNVDGQARVISEALAVADISSDTVSYVEAHGTGTKLGDPIEVTALSQAYQQDTRKKGYCAIASVKTNVGHLQMASGIVGLIKTTLCLYHQKIPASLHFNHPNPQIDFERSPFYLNTQLQDWKSNNYPRRAGVNSLGIGGTNAHVILEEFVNNNQTPDQLLPAYLLTLSAKNATALQELATNYQSYIQKHDHLSLQEICFTSNIGRHHFDVRCAIVAADKQELVNQLSNISTNTIQQNYKLAFLFTGQASQYIGMARQLYNTCDVFQENCDRCFQICDINVVGDFDLNQTEYTQPLLFIIEYSLAQMWLAWGIKPDVMIGHSIGEYVAATIAGVFSLEAALKLVCTRGKLMQRLPKNGAMLAVFTSENRIKSLLGNKISLAADNGSHLVLSGLKDDLDHIAQELDLLGIKTQSLNVAHGFHSPLMQPIIAEFKAVAETVSYSAPRIPIVSNLIGELADKNIASPAYWIDHILQPVQFAKGIKYLDEQQVNIFLEIGTKPTLRRMAESILSNRNNQAKLLLHSLDHNQKDWQSILKTLAQLYIAGLNINWLAVTKNYPANKISLPTYPFQRQRYWFDLPRTVIKAKLIKKDLLHPLLGQQIFSPLKQTIFQSYLQPQIINWLEDHRLEARIVFPGTGYIEIAIALGLFHYQSNQLLIENLDIFAPLYIENNLEPGQEIQIIASNQQDSCSWEIYSLNNSEWKLHCSSQISFLNLPIKGKQLIAIKKQLQNVEQDVKQHYLFCQQQGINYGKSFQDIKQLWAKDYQALGLIELPTHLNSNEYHFHPALLDACLQILFAALPKELQTYTYIPIGLDKLYLYCLPSNKVWSYLELNPTSNQKILTADVWLYNDNGDLIAKLEGLKSQAIKFQPTWHNWLYQPQWKPKPLLSQSTLTNSSNWLIFDDSTGIGKQVATQLQSQQQICHLIKQNTIDNNPQAFDDLIQQYPTVTGVIYLWSLDAAENWEECQSYLYLIQALTKLSGNSHLHLYLVTRNAQPVDNYQLSSGIRNSCLWGMQKAIALEYPELVCMAIDLPPDSTNEDAVNIYQEICGAEIEQVAYRDSQRYVSRLVRFMGADIHSPQQNLESNLNLQLQINNPGNLDSLQWQSVTHQQPKDNEIEIEVKATGLNFRDVMVALDLYPDDSKFLGLECAGVVKTVGKAVSNFKISDQVIAIGNNSFSQYLTVNSLLAIHKPATLSFIEAATIPVTFLTAYYSLTYLAQLQPGEKVLIHAAAGGVGLAAIQIAQQIGAQIYATASDPKWELLKSMGVKNIFNSRSLDFAEQIRSVTDGEGVDVVLNSLSKGFIPNSLAILNQQGRFIEIGKQGIWSPEEVMKVKPSINYSIVDLWQITQDKPELIQQMLIQLLSQFTTSKLKPLPYTTFSSDQTITAFRYMQQGKHQGKIIVLMDSQADISYPGNSSIVPNPTTFTGTYLITGGTGAIGLQVAQWLITKGVTNLVLLGRNHPKPKYQDSLKKLQQNAQVNLIKADIADTDQLAQALKQIESNLPPLHGVVHCAGIISDRTIQEQDWDSFKEVLAPKVKGAWNLHCLTQKYNLESFILFSSASSLIGSAGQANYCGGNAFLDTLAHARHHLGLPAITINWGAWSQTGLAADLQITEELKRKGIGSIKPNQSIEILEQLLLDYPVQVGVIPINWQQWQKHHPVTTFYEDLVELNTLSLNVTNDRQQLLNAIPEQREILLRQQIIQQVGNILGIKDLRTIDLELGFSELGLDSLGSVELRNKLQSSYDLRLSQTVIFDYANIKQLAKHLLSLMFNDQSLAKNLEIDDNLISVVNLSEAEAEALLLEELDAFDF
jgi:acyl transferase domain-containing protein/acyl-CoA synthetase (AMP-forming)/AMP-acid ligase II/Zn-dependent alcohol dehydrogenase/NAD(P)-dependent dehydrogenase (short-subunit alcohol dehydrogenase family)/acyl carrier protein